MIRQTVFSDGSEWLERATDMPINEADFAAEILRKEITREDH